MKNSDPILPDPGAPGIDDTELMELSRAGAKDAFQCLIRRHQQPLLNFFARMGVYNDAEDLVQETFIRLFKCRERYRPTAKFTTFLYTIARTVLLDKLRGASRLEAKKEKFRSDGTTAHEQVDNGLPLRIDMQAALDRLPEKLRSVVVLSYWQGLRYDEIAAVLEIPAGTVKSRMFLALIRLKEIFEREK